MGAEKSLDFPALIEAGSGVSSEYRSSPGSRVAHARLAAVAELGGGSRRQEVSCCGAGEMPTAARLRRRSSFLIDLRIFYTLQAQRSVSFDSTGTAAPVGGCRSGLFVGCVPDSAKDGTSTVLSLAFGQSHLDSQ